MELSAAALALDLHAGEKRYQRMGAHRDDGAGVECHQCCALLCGQAKAVGVAGSIGEKGGAGCLVVGEAVQGAG